MGKRDPAERVLFAVGSDDPFLRGMIECVRVCVSESACETKVGANYRPTVPSQCPLT